MSNKQERNQTAEIDGKLCLSSLAMADVFGVTRAALSKWAQQGCPKVKAGWWSLKDVIEWRGLGGDKPQEDDDLSDHAKKLKYEAEWKRLQSENLELKNALAKGDLIPREEIVTELRRYFVTMKKSIQALSRKHATEIDPFVDPPTMRRIQQQLAELDNDALRLMAIGEDYAAPRRRVVKG